MGPILFSMHHVWFMYSTLAFIQLHAAYDDHQPSMNKMFTQLWLELSRNWQCFSDVIAWNEKLSSGRSSESVWGDWEGGRNLLSAAGVPGCTRPAAAICVCACVGWWLRSICTFACICMHIMYYEYIIIYYFCVGVSCRSAVVCFGALLMCILHAQEVCCTYMLDECLVPVAW